MLGIALQFVTIMTCYAENPTPLTNNNDNDPNVILYYISNTWKTLQRSMDNCETFSDPKTHMTSILYLPADLPMPKELIKLKERCALTINRLPKSIKNFGEVNGGTIVPSGLLYLPHPYVVPGGMFNEMYGWDSYFIIRGLIEDNKVNIAHGMLDNFFFEIEHYGGTLNGNRTYYLTRSQLPFLAPAIRAVYTADLKQHKADKTWLAKAYRYAEKDYNLWTRAPHLAGNTGLSRYYDFGNGAVSELDDTAKSYYEDVVKYFLIHPEMSRQYLYFPDEEASAKKRGSLFTVSLCDKNDSKACKLFKNVGLSDIFYKGDRAMRESGFDTSFRFGPFSADTLHYVPLDLNSLLYKAEEDLEWMSKKLGKTQQAYMWHKRALLRKDRINYLLWNNKTGMYYDYNYKHKQQSKHMYATTFYPLWAGLASKEQAARIAENLKLFEKPGGIVTSLNQTGVQWDYPYGWAPIQLIAIEGLSEYGYKDDADRISNKYLMMVLKNFMKEKTIREKYDVVSCTSKTNIQVGYKLNVTGFGWTNGVFLVLLNRLPSQVVKKLMTLEEHKIIVETK